MRRKASASPRPGITASTAVGDTVVEGGDNSGAIALQDVITKSQSFNAAGGISAQTASLSDYAAAFYQNVSTLSNTVTTNQTTQDDRLQKRNRAWPPTPASTWMRNSPTCPPTSRPIARGARLLTVVDQLYTTLLQIQ